MLSDSTAFSSFTTDRLAESFAFYRDILELDCELVHDRFLHVYLPTGNYVIIYFKADHQAGNHTVLNFQVKEIETVVDQLRRKGIKFEAYDVPFETDAKGISWDDEGSHLAWFKDPGGNIIALIEN